MSCATLHQLPRFIDPISRVIVEHLHEGLLLQQDAASTTVSAELEVRLGTVAPHRRLHTPTLPIEFDSAAVLSERNRHMYTFQPGVSAPVLNALLADLVDAGIAPRATVTGKPRDTLILHCRGGRRAVYNVHDSGVAAAAAVDPAEHLTAVLSGTRSFGGARDVVTTRNEVGKRTATLAAVSLKARARPSIVDICCPEWGTDLRLSLSTESQLPSCAGDLGAVDEVELVRLRRRLSLPLPPHLRLEVSVERASSNIAPLQWALRNSPLLQPTFPLPSMSQPHAQCHVELEVVLPELLRGWRQYHGLRVVPRLHNKDGQQSTTTITAAAAAAVRKVTGPEAGPRTPAADPFLRHVAEEVLTLVQFLSAKRGIVTE